MKTVYRLLPTLAAGLLVALPVVSHADAVKGTAAAPAAGATTAPKAASTGGSTATTGGAMSSGAAPKVDARVDAKSDAKADAKVAKDEAQVGGHAKGAHAKHHVKKKAATSDVGTPSGSAAVAPTAKTGK